MVITEASLRRQSLSAKNWSKVAARLPQSQVSISAYGSGLRLGLAGPWGGRWRFLKWTRARQRKKACHTSQPPPTTWSPGLCHVYLLSAHFIRYNLLIQLYLYVRLAHLHTFGTVKNILIFNKNTALYALCGKICGISNLGGISSDPINHKIKAKQTTLQLNTNILQVREKAYSFYNQVYLWFQGSLETVYLLL